VEGSLGGEREGMQSHRRQLNGFMALGGQSQTPALQSGKPLKLTHMGCSPPAPHQNHLARGSVRVLPCASRVCHR
jgi:hypothetical protein